jgi:hypothetical protein
MILFSNLITEDVGTEKIPEPGLAHPEDGLKRMISLASAVRESLSVR